MDLYSTPCASTMRGSEPAFPRYGSGDRGVSRREYFAVHAPAIPDWFQPVRKTVRPVAPMVPFARGSVESTEYFSVINGLLVKDRACKAVQDFCRTVQNVKRAQGEWDAQGDSERFFAWRWHFADMMIETEGK